MYNNLFLFIAADTLKDGFVYMLFIGLMIGWIYYVFFMNKKIKAKQVEIIKQGSGSNNPTDVIEYPTRLNIKLVYEEEDDIEDEEVFYDLVIKYQELIGGNYKFPEDMLKKKREELGVDGLPSIDGIRKLANVNNDMEAVKVASEAVGNGDVGSEPTDNEAEQVEGDSSEGFIEESVERELPTEEDILRASENEPMPEELTEEDFMGSTTGEQEEQEQEEEVLDEEEIEDDFMMNN